MNVFVSRHHSIIQQKHVNIFFLSDEIDAQLEENKRSYPHKNNTQIQWK